MQDSLRSADENLNASSFERVDLQVEKLYWLSESIVLVLTRKMELKIFYT